MKVAVTGATGFVGREVLRRLAVHDHTAVPLVRTPAGLAGEVVTGDLSDGRVNAGQLSGCGAVIHLAARTHVMNETASDPMAEYRRVNVEGTARLLDASLEAGIERFVYMSSVKAIGEWSQPGSPLGPNTTPRPEDAYGKTKLEAERLVRDRCEAAGVGWVILRPPLIYGPGVKANFARLVSWVARGIPLPFGMIDNRRSLVDVANLADAAVLALTAEKASGHAFMVSDTTVSTPQMIRAIGAAVGRSPRLLPVPPFALKVLGKATGKQAELDRICGSLELDATRARELLEWQPHRSFEQSLAEIAADMGHGAYDAQPTEKTK